MQDYGMRIYDKRGIRFLSVDPIKDQYPMLTPYQFASNSPISGIDLDGLEYINSIRAEVRKELYGGASTGEGAGHKKLSDFYDALIADAKASGKEYGYVGSNTSKKLSVLDCKEYCAAQYALGDQKVAKYLKDAGMPKSRENIVAWFAKGGKHHSFIDAYKGGLVTEQIIGKNSAENGSPDPYMDTDVTQRKYGVQWKIFGPNGAQPGDIVFEGGYGPDEGHMAILKKAPDLQKVNGKIVEGAKLTLIVDSAFKGSKETGYVGGERKLEYRLTKGSDGQLFWKSTRTDKNRALVGFGRVDEAGIKKQKK